MIRRIVFAVSFLVLLASASAHAQALLEPPPPAPPAPSAQAEAIGRMNSIPALMAQGQQYQQAGDWASYALVLQRLIKLRPFLGVLRYELAAAYAMQDMKPESYDSLVRLQGSGYAYDIAADQRFKNVHGTELWTFLLENFSNNGRQFGSGKVVATLPKGDNLHESVAWDPKSGSFLVGSARKGTIVRIAAGGEPQDFIAPDAANGLWGVFDLVADPARDALWVASGASVLTPHAKPEDYGRSGVFRFRLSDGGFVSKTLLPADGQNHLLTALAVTPQGLVFAIDSVSNRLLKVEGEGFRVVVQNPQLGRLRALAATDDGKTLYFSDYELGLFGIDLASGKGFDVATNERVSLEGIDRLAWYQGHLLVLQNGFKPNRAMRFAVSPDGRKVIANQALDASQPAWSAPTGGTLAGDRFVFIADSQRGLLDAYGNVRDPDQLAPVELWSSDARLAWNVQVDDDALAGAKKSAE
ncbi:MAG TPA: hypothetical protein PLI00_09210 [Pseudomonadota bacterium]|nr:hypothetical protein [Pseudomonadota bacterium]